MLPPQRPARLFAVIELCKTPVFGGMAAITGLTMPPRMDVTAAMATGTVSRGGIFCCMSEVTGLAGLFLMGASERKICLRRVIKELTGPVSFGMAALAVLTVTTLMHIVHPMAADTLDRFKRVLLTRVATRALQGIMLPF